MKATFWMNECSVMILFPSFGVHLWWLFRWKWMFSLHKCSKRVLTTICDICVKVSNSLDFQHHLMAMKRTRRKFCCSQNCIWYSISRRDRLAIASSLRGSNVIVPGQVFRRSFVIRLSIYAVGSKMSHPRWTDFVINIIRTSIQILSIKDVGKMLIRFWRFWIMIFCFWYQIRTNRFESCSE